MGTQNFQLKKTLIEEKTEQIYDTFEYENVDEAFQSLSVSLIFDVSFNDISEEEIVDGGQDKQIDIIRIEDNEQQGYANIHIIQSKNTSGFSSNKLIHISNGLSWIFEVPKNEFSKIDNIKFKNKIEEIRELRKDYGQDGLSVCVYFVTNGDAQDLSDEYKQEKRKLITKYQNIGFNKFDFKELGASELVELLEISERKKKKIDLDIPIIYDVNKPSIIEYSNSGTSALICSIKGTELAKLGMTEHRDAIFDVNVRTFYGAQGKVNSEIKKTCSNNDEANLFWFMNNGITILCDKFDVVKDPDNPFIKVFNIQIANGCQTTATLREALENNLLSNNVTVLARIYSTEDNTLVDKITFSTNNQNQITDRDLRANDSVQKDLQRIINDKYNFHYERKNKEFSKLKSLKKKRIISNSKAAQAYLAIVRKKPSIARGFKGKIWTEHYEEIFKNATAEDLVFSNMIIDYCDKQSKIISRNKDEDPLMKEVAVYGRFHIARLMGNELVTDKWGTEERKKIESLINEFQKGSNDITDSFDKSILTLLEERSVTIEEHPNPSLYFKALDIQKRIERKLFGK